MRDFPDKIIENVIANLIAAGIIAGVSVAIVFLRSQGIALTISVSLNIVLLGTCLLLFNRKSKARAKIIENNAKPIKKAPKYNFLPDRKQPTDLKLDNVLLTEAYGKVLTHAIKWTDDAKLSSFSVHVWPYGSTSYTLIWFEFFSSWAMQSRSWSFDNFGEISEDDLPTHHTKEQPILTDLPWIKHPDWLKSLNKAYIQIVKLPEAEYSRYWIQTHNPSNLIWLISFVDGVSGRKYNFEWSPEMGLKKRE